MTLAAGHVLIACEVNDLDFVSVGLYRGCDAVHTRAFLFGSALALPFNGIPDGMDCGARFAV
jgi:hypothetical protein